MIISDKAKKIVEDYSSFPKTARSAIFDQVSKLKESFASVITGKAKDIEKKPVAAGIAYSFSADQKL